MSSAKVVVSILPMSFLLFPNAKVDAGTDRREDVERLIRPVIEAGLVPGAVVGIYERGQTRVMSFGRVKPGEPAAPDGRTIYEMGSITKVFTGILLADAVQRGQFNLDDPLSKHLPKGVRPPKRDGKEILVWHLATHTSGLPRLPTNMEAKGDNPYHGYGKSELWEYISGCRPATAPGSTHAYSNLGMGLLGTLLAETADTSYENLIEERIAKPLGMSDTTVSLSRAQGRRLAPAHDAGGRQVSNWKFGTLVGCGGLRTTVDDMLKLIGAMLSDGNDGIHGVLKLSMQRRFTIPDVPGQAGFGLGWQIAQDGLTLWHGGQTGGYHCSVFVIPFRKSGVVVLSNGADPAISVVAERIIQTIFGMAVEPPEIRRSISVTAEQLDRLVGVYPSTAGFVITVTREGEALFARLTNQQALRVYPESPTLFFYREVEAELGFEIDQSTGKAKAVTLFQHGMEFHCPRKD